MANNPQPPQTSTLQYPIVNTAFNTPMKAIALQNIPTFHESTLEDPDVVLFEFDFLCRVMITPSTPRK